MLKDVDTKMSAWSKDEVELICDYCGNEFRQRFAIRTEAYRKNPKDACKNCRTTKREETSMLRYGTKTPSQNAEVRAKASKTKGGTGKSITEFKDKILDLYNIDNTSIKHIASTIGVTRSVLMKYMKELGLDTKGDVQAKQKKTCKERYGVEHFLQCEEGQKKLKTSIKEKYGVENLYENADVKRAVLDKSRQTCLEKYGVEYVVQDPNRQKEFEEKRQKTRRKNGQIIFNGMTVPQMAANKGMASSSFYERIQKFGLEEAINRDKNCSYLEHKIAEWLNSIGVTYKTEHYVEGKIADFCIGDLLLELDGFYYHCDTHITDDNYHIKKKEIYHKGGFRSLFFREDEIVDKFDIVTSIISNQLGLSTKIYARKCTMRKLSLEESNKFFNNNHLMGGGGGNGYGLFYDEELKSAIRIRCRKGDSYEISRFCNLLNTTVIGGFSKLLKFAETDLNPGSITTFIDCRYGSGSYLADLGFKYIGSHPSFKWIKGKKSVHRMKFPSNSGYKEGWAKIWDCGQAKYVKTLKGV